MDIYITFTDENDECLNCVNIYQDGSDIEGTEEIVEWLLENYEGARISEAPYER